MAERNIVVTVEDGDAIPNIPDLFVGDIVSCSSPDGKAQIVFELIPAAGEFVGTLVADGFPMMLDRPGPVRCNCSVILADKTVVGWTPENPRDKSGSEPDIRPRPAGGG